MFASLLSLFTFSSLVTAGTIRRREDMAVASVKDITIVIERINNGIEKAAAEIQVRRFYFQDKLVSYTNCLFTALGRRS